MYGPAKTSTATSAHSNTGDRHPHLASTVGADSCQVQEVLPHPLNHPGQSLQVQQSHAQTPTKAAMTPPKNANTSVTALGTGDQLQELLPGQLGVIGEAAQHLRGSGESARCLDTSNGHAHVLCLHDDSHTLDVGT